MLIMGTDPGIANIGVAVIDWMPQHRSTVLFLETIHTDAKASMQHRIEQIHREMTTFWPGVECMGIEEQERAWQGKQQRAQTNATSTRARVGEGALRMMAAERGVPVIDLEPAQTRAALGLSGSAKKEMVLLAARRVFKITQCVSAHALDALGIAHAIGQRWSILRQRPGALQPRT